MPRSKATEFDPNDRPLDSEAGAESGPRRCDVPGCGCDGMFRAPKSRDRLNDYYWLCLDHVRQYNAAWDFFAGMSPQEIELQLRRDTTWQRPTWPLGARRGDGMFRAAAEPPIDDPFGVFEDGFDAAERARAARAAAPEFAALRELQLDAPITLGQLRDRYKELVKRHHPDANGGDKDAEERLKSINQAYATLRALFDSDGRPRATSGAARP